MSRLSLRGRIVLHFTAVTAFLLLAFAGLLYLAVRASLMRGLDADLRARATALAALVEREGDGFEVELDGATQPSPDLVGGLSAWAILGHPHAELLLESPRAREHVEPGSLWADVPWQAGRPLERVRPLELGGRFATLARPRLRAFSGVFAVRDEEPEGEGPALVRIFVAKDLAPVARTLGRLTGVLAAIGAATFLVAAGAGTLLARRIVRPLARIAEDAEAVRTPDEPREIRGSGAGDEIDRLAATLNATFARLRESYERQTRFTADASHELRTPVAAIRSQAEVTLRRERTAGEYRESLAAIEREAVRLTELIEALLTMARLDRGGTETRLEVVRVDELAAGCIGELTAAAAGAGVELRLVAPAPARVRGEHRLLGIALSNLLSNAIRHGARPGSVEVRVEEANGEVVCAVHDDGAGIPAHALARVFDRFYRVQDDRARSSGAAGLGLAIVASIARLHGGSVSVRSEPGTGTTFTVRLPRAAWGSHGAAPAVPDARSAGHRG